MYPTLQPHGLQHTRPPCPSPTPGVYSDSMAPHSSTLAWKIPWMEEPRRLQSMGSLRVGHDWATSLSLFTFMNWRRKCNPLQCSSLENPRDEGVWQAAIYGVAQSRTQLKQLSSSSCCMSIESVMPSNHLILCHPLLLLPSIFPSVGRRVSSLHQVAEVLEFQLQHQSFQ